MYTLEEAKAWALKNSQKLDAARLICPEAMVRLFNEMAPELSKLLWDSGCWLGEALRQHGATAEQVSSIQMAQGQRSVGGDPWKVAVDYANEFAEKGCTQEAGGAELAEKVHKE